MQDTTGSSPPAESVEPAADQPDRPDLFVSYSRQDAEFVRRLHDALTERGKSVWVDWAGIPKGSRWRDKIDTGIEAAKAVVTVLSPEFAGSDVCAQEVEHASRHNKRFIPILRRRVDSKRLRPELAEIDWISFLDGDDFDRATDQLVATAETDLGWLDDHARLTARAREWERGGRDKSFLLTGSDLRRSESWYAEQDRHKERATDLQVAYLIASRTAATRRQRITLGFVSAALVVALALTGISLFLRHEAIAREHEARSRELASLATAQLGVDPELAMILAREAARIAHTSQAERVLRQAILASNVRETLDLGVAAPLRFASLAPDERHLVAVGVDGSARGWDLANRTNVPLTGRMGAAVPSELKDVAFSGDSRRVALVGNDLRVRIRRLPGWEHETTLPGRFQSVELNHDGSRVLLERAIDDLEIRRVRSGELVRALDLGEVPSGVFSPADDTVAVEGSAIVRILRGPTWSRARPLGAGLPPGGSKPTDPGLFSPKGHLLATGSEGVPYIWNVATGRLVAALKSPSDFPVAFSPDERRLLTANSFEPAMRIWDAGTGKLLTTLDGHPTGNLEYAAFTDDARRVITASSDGTAIVWNASAARGAALAVLRGHGASVLAASLAGSTALTVGADATARWWEATPWRISTYLDRPPKAAWTTDDGIGAITELEQRPMTLWHTARRDGRLQWSRMKRFGWTLSDFAVRDARHIVVVDGRGATVREAATGEEVRFVPAAPGNATVSSDGSLVAITTVEDHMIVRSLADGREIARLTAEGASAFDFLEISPDARFIFASKSEGDTELWNVKDKERRRLGTGIFDRGDFTRDGRRFVTVRSGAPAQIIDTTSDQVTELRGQGFVSTARFSPDGELVLTGGADVGVWDTQTGDIIGLLRTGSAGYAAFSHDGRDIVSWSDNGAVRLAACDACRPFEELFEVVERRNPRALTAAERAELLGD